MPPKRVEADADVDRKTSPPSRKRIHSLVEAAIKGELL
jgi:hypothetical protein